MLPKARIYVAAPFSRRSIARSIRDTLEAAGYSVCSSWLDVDETTCSLAQEAKTDMYDVLRCDAMVVLNLGLVSEGKAVEQGMAIIAEKPIYVVGDRPQNVFQTLPNYTFAPDIERVIDALDYEYR